MPISLASLLPTLSSTLLASSLLLAAVLPASAAPLAAEQWQKRVVLLFAPDKDKLRVQLDGLLRDKAALAERDMLVLAVDGGMVDAAFGEPTGKLEAEALRNAYGVAADDPFTVVLVGKDGGEKLRAHEPVAVRDLLGLVDSMPMRQREAGG